MARQAIDEDFNNLVPEMQAWNNGAGIEPTAWIGCEGRIELAIGYTLVFWPRFILIDDYVLRESVTEASLREWERTTRGDRKAIEAIINHWHIADLHHDGASATEAQLRYLGRILKQIHEVKLGSDFPDRTFVVSFNDEPGPEFIDYQLTFWQVRE